MEQLMSDNVKKIDNYLVYNEKPLVKNGPNMVYGNFTEAAYADMIILSEKEEVATDGTKHSVPDNIMVTILSTDKSVTAPLRATEFRRGLYDALEYSYTQIERYNSK